jgi:predicted regulator of Ras-like GTPase activity (Roadblock/LC7/MglB family)
MIKGRSGYVLKAHAGAESGGMVLAGTNAEQGLIALDVRRAVQNSAKLI